MGRIGRALRNARHNFVGRCNVCGHRVVFICTDVSAARGNFFCPVCRSFSRKRHVVAVLLQALGVQNALSAVSLEKDVYSATCNDALWKALGEDPRFEGSELHDGLPYGAALPNGGSCQNLEALTFPDASFDVVLTEDVLEHVRYPDRAFSEIARVLRPGGVHIFTVPLAFDHRTIERVEPREDGDDRLLTEPEWHGDNVHGRALAYRTFGVDIFERLEGFGFTTRLHQASYETRRIGVVDSYVFESRLDG